MPSSVPINVSIVVAMLTAPHYCLDDRCSRRFGLVYQSELFKFARRPLLCALASLQNRTLPVVKLAREANVYVQCVASPLHVAADCSCHVIKSQSKTKKTRNLKVDIVVLLHRY